MKNKITADVIYVIFEQAEINAFNHMAYTPLSTSVLTGGV